MLDSPRFGWGTKPVRRKANSKKGQGRIWIFLLGWQSLVS